MSTMGVELQATMAEWPQLLQAGCVWEGKLCIFLPLGSRGEIAQPIDHGIRALASLC